VRLIVEIQRIGNQFLQIHLGRPIAAPVSAGSAARSAPALAAAFSTWPAPAALAAAGSTIFTTRTTASGRTSAFTLSLARWTILSAFALLGFLLF
jgi:hypothetical protein